MFQPLKIAATNRCIDPVEFAAFERAYWERSRAITAAPAHRRKQVAEQARREIADMLSVAPVTRISATEVGA